MSRSLKKGMHIDEALMRKVTKLRAEGKTSGTIKTYARSSTIFPELVGFKLDIHNGNKFKTVFVREDMVGHKVGEFSLSRKFQGHAKKGRLAKSYGSTGRFLAD